MSNATDETKQKYVDDPGNAEKERGPMSSKEFETIKTFYPELMRVIDVNILVPYMISQSVFDMEDKACIDEKEGKAEKNEKLLEILCWSGETAFKTFIEVLKRAGYDIHTRLQRYHQNPKLEVSEKKRGPMKRGDEKIIQEKYAYLCDNLDADNLLRYMIQSSIFNLDDYKQVKKEIHKGRQHGMLKFMDILNNSGYDAYPKFLEALSKAGYTQVVATLNTLNRN